MPGVFVLSTKVLVVGCPMTTLFRATSYPVTPTLSVEAVHEKATWVFEVVFNVRFCGTDGDIISWSGARGTDTGRGLEDADTLPLESRAFKLFFYVMA
jgi:hypothetical protein